MAIAQYKHSLKQLLPPGRCWQWAEGSTGDKLLEIIAQAYNKIDSEASKLPDDAIKLHGRRVRREFTLTAMEKHLRDKGFKVRLSDGLEPLEVGFEVGAECRPEGIRFVVSVHYRFFYTSKAYELALREECNKIRQRHITIELLAQ